MPTPTPIPNVLHLGKKKAVHDPRTLQLRNVMLAAPTLPLEYHIDVALKAQDNIDLPVDALGNKQYGCCVISARGHATRRFEVYETKKLIPLTAKEVVDQYFKESGGVDSGLVMLDSLKSWKKGWIAGGQKLLIYGYAAINRQSQEEYKQSIYARIGCYLGVSLPQSAQQEMNRGRGWSITAGPGSTPGSWGGHAIYIEGYDPTGLTCITWGQKQHMTWGWLSKYCDEAYAVIDAIDTVRAKQLIHKTKFEDELARVI